jgi:hypothetical protein
LLDLRFPDDQVARDRAVLALGSTVGGRVLADIVGSVDRWGRHAGRLALIEGSGPVDLAELLVGEGLALSMWASATGSAPPGSSRSKRRRVVAARGSGRARARPLSRRPTRSGLPAGRAVRDRGGPCAQRRRTGPSDLPQFRGFRREAFTATIPSRARAAFAGRIAELRGRTVRLRGIVELRRGPTIELVSPDMLEVLPLAPARP